MSTWTAPSTWANAAVTAAQMNAEIRDHALFLKGALDVLTASSTADTGATMFLSETRPTVNDYSFRTQITGDTQPRFYALAGGAIAWGSGSAAADTSLYRLSANALKTDDALYVGDILVANGGSAITVGNGISLVKGTESGHTADFILMVYESAAYGGVIQFGLGDSSGSRDVALYRYAADTLKTDDGFWAPGGIVTKVKAGVPADGDFVAGMQQSGAMALDTTNSRIYFRVGSTWKYATLT